MSTKVTGLKPGAIKVLVGIAIVAAIFLVKHFVLDAPKAIASAQTVNKFQLADAAEDASLKSASQKLPIPSSTDNFTNKGTGVTWVVMAWNSQFPLMYANGGAKTVDGSLFAKSGLNVEIKRQDDCNKTIGDFIKNTQDLKSDPNTVPVVMSFMGDGVPGFTVSLEKELSKLGPDGDYIAFYAMGRSDGEDAFMGPKEWKANPQLAKGHCVAGVERDGDLNIVFEWARDNNIPVNADSKYFDSSALNIIPASDFLDAANKYITSYTEEKEIVSNGKTTGQKVKVTTDAATTWTPGDVNIAEQKGGLVRLASTHDYTSQMPNISIINKKWAYAHRDEMVKIINALGQAGDQVRSYPEAAQFAAEVSAKVYGDKKADYWLKYWHGVPDAKDVTGLKVPLGGSKAFNLKDAANVFGLGDDHKDRYKVTYESFGSLLNKLYPNEMKGYAAYSKIVDKTFLMSAIANADQSTIGDASAQTYASGDITEEVASKSVNIQFENGSAEISPASRKALQEIYSSATIAEGLKVGVIGHTNAVGSEPSNVTLSQARASAVVTALKKLGVASQQLDTPKGVGSSEPIDGTDPKDASNRRVEIILGH